MSDSEPTTPEATPDDAETTARRSRGHAASAPEPARSKARILVAEDTTPVRQIMVHLLEEAGYETIQARHGEEAVSLASLGRFDLVLLDIMMPGLSGYEVCSMLRRQPATRSVPILMVTARGSREAVVEAVKAGADGYVVKPFQKQVLLDKVRETLERRAGESAR